jgi:hypothetical protein
VKVSHMTFEETSEIQQRVISLEILGLRIE